MDSQQIRNLQEAYLGVYDNLDEERAEGVKPYKARERNPLPKEKPLSGEKGDGSGYGADKKFTKPDDKIAKPGTTVPAPKKGGYGRISPTIPHGIGDHADRVQSRVSTITNKDPGAPKSQKLTPKEKTKPSREIVRKNLNNSYDLYDLILSHLLDEGYAESVDSAEAIMVNMSEDWRESIVYDQQLDEISIGMKRRAADASVDKVDRAGKRVASSRSVDVQPYLRNQLDKAEKQHLRLAKAAKDVK
jgi:hypothetical protein